MSNKTPSLRIGIFGHDLSNPEKQHGCCLWRAGYASCIEASEAIPVHLGPLGERSWDEALGEIHGVLLVGHDNSERLSVTESESLCHWAKENLFPILAVDHGLHALNSAFGGTTYQDLPREMPDALQHRHPPEPGLRHAINVEDGTRMSKMYGEGEIIVNSEHRRAVQRVARGFKVGAYALDQIVEAIESKDEDWFAVGIQWHPASSTASGLDIQVFRGLIQAAEHRFAMADTQSESSVAAA